MSRNLLKKPITIKNLTIPNRTVLPPMCQYSVTKKDGVASDWHYLHYVSRAIGQTGLIIVESSGVQPNGRITDHDIGLWDDSQIEPLAKIVEACHKYGSKTAIQLGHAGRKAVDTKNPVSSSEMPIVIDGQTVKPKALTIDEIDKTIDAFTQAAKRAVKAGFDAVEVHGAHGYLVHQFHSPSINKRTDEYGKDYSLFGCKIIKAIKAVIPKDMPLLLRISAVEYIDGGYGLEHSLEITKKYIDCGVDCLDISSGGEDQPGKVKPGNYPGYQLAFAKAFKDAFDIPVIAVGMLDDYKVAHYALASGKADMVAVGRGMLSDPYWPLHAMQDLKVQNIPIPEPYLRGIRQTPEG